MTRAWPVHNLDPDASLAENARRILRVRIAEYYAYAPIIGDASATEELHDLRISAKRLRYTLELFRSTFGAQGEAAIVDVKAIQTELGTLHDHDVRISMIERELSEVVTEQFASLGRSFAVASPSAFEAISAVALRPPPDDPRRGLIGLLARQHASRQATFARFHTLWQVHESTGVRARLAALSSLPVLTPAAHDAGASGE